MSDGVCDVRSLKADGRYVQCVNKSTHFILIRTGRKNSGSRRFELCALHAVLHENTKGMRKIAP